MINLDIVVVVAVSKHWREFAAFTATRTIIHWLHRCSIHGQTRE